MSIVLPTEGSTTLDYVASAICEASSTLGVEDTAELRAVIVPAAGGQLISFAAVLRVGWPSKLKDDVIVLEAGGITLVAERFVASDVLGKQDLIDILNGWRPFAHYKSALGFHDSVNIDRHASHSQWSVEPTWVLQLQETTTTGLRHQTRSGPFLHAESGFFAENIGDAARQWLGDPHLDRNSHAGVYKVVMRDRRAWLRNLKIDFDTGQLSVDLERTTKAPVFLTVVTKELDGKRAAESQEVASTPVPYRVPLPLAEIRVVLTDSTGTPYDDFGESAQYAPRGRPSVLAPPPVTDPEYQELREALDAGESGTVEFKEWLPVDREKPKSYELLKAATAFANALGGVIYVGVTDDCEVVGTAHHLRNDFTNASSTNRDDLRDEYARVVRRLLNQGISPAPAHNVSWVTHAGLPVLRIQILSKGVVHHVVEDGAIYIRRAASDRKATPAEFEAIVAQRATAKGGPFPS